MKWEKLKPPEPDDPMCCCECDLGQYGCCWDCSDVDEACHRWLKRSQSDMASSSVICAAINKLELSMVPALVLLPVLLRVAALHCLLGAGVLTALPALLLWYYHATHRAKRRTLFFLTLALHSLAYMYYLFLTEVLPRGGVDRLQVFTVTSGMVLTLVSLVHTKRGPGFVVESPGRRGSQRVGVSDTHHHHHHDSVTAQASSEHNHSHQQHNGAVHQQAVVETGRSRTETEVPVNVEKRRSRCPLCRVERPPRAGHCRICGSCVKRLDHHCIWINSCVGQANHRSFLLTLSIFLLTSLYGISLVLHSVCPHQYLITALLYCPGVYNHYSTALCFTCAWYSSIVTGGLLHLLVIQVINISYNVTEREAQLALRNRTGRSRLYGLVIDTGLYSRGFYNNWLEFLTMADGSLQTPACSSLSV